MPPRKPTPAGRQWSSTEGVRAEFLDAARAVFARRGFTEASVTEVVERAGASVGSLYHHFGSKTDLFLALWRRHHEEQLRIARGGLDRARESGVTDPFDLFVAGARAYLEATWSRRDLVRIFQVGDTPPGFHEIQHRDGREWINRNFKLLGADDDPVHRVLIWLVTSFLGEARREISKARTAREATVDVEAMIETLKRMRPLLTGDLGLGLSYREVDEG
ncbi:MAG TPA: TetR family transcriptional regulator [Actinophytocola sp.]|uniref:TetR/AcrR family transcriptional regulator n=1 Tax=Actinophytocola sp. TaxID=1872138 RepID=UPI002DBAA3D4|nr:TetR family transcriptional regulator [Actinophytocola sp.]HEU5470735.1 TetR family transcriptional regulator [Actinophytocola sp.]